MKAFILRRNRIHKCQWDRFILLNKTRLIHRLCLTVCILLTAIILMGCSAKKVISIGVVGTMSGTQSDLSVSGRRGVEIAVKEINASGGIMGKKVELVVKDDKNDPKRSQEIVDEFVNEGVDIVIGNYTSGMLTAAYDIIQQRDIVYVGPTISADSLNGIDDHFIRFIPSTREQADTIIKDVTKKGYQGFLVVLDEKNKGFSDALLNNFEEQLQRSGGTIEQLISYDQLDTHVFESIQTSIKENKAIDSMFIIGNGTDIAAIAQQLTKEDIHLPTYGPLWSHTSDLIIKGSQAVEGIVVVSGIDMSSNEAKFISFRKTYQELYGEDVTFAAMYSYESMMAIAQAMKESKKSDWESVKNTLINIQTYSGIQSDYSLDEFGDNKRAYGLDTILDGEYRRID